MPEVETTVLSYGMGVESTAILLRWCLEEDTRPCPLDRIVVITAQVGDEYKDSGRDLETYVADGAPARHPLRAGRPAWILGGGWDHGPGRFA